MKTILSVVVNFKNIFLYFLGAFLICGIYITFNMFNVSYYQLLLLIIFASYILKATYIYLIEVNYD